MYCTNEKAMVAALPAAATVASADRVDPVGAIVDAVARSIGVPASAPECIHYFHGTRVMDPDRFEIEGLWPLEMVLDAIWDAIVALVPEVRPRGLARLREDMTSGMAGPHTYALRTRSERERGPYAHLVRDALEHPEAYSSVDYLSGAEIAVDICAAVRERFGIDAPSRWMKATVPCIVEFTSQSEHVQGALASALWYGHAGLDAERTRHANWCFDGCGEAVPAASVLVVDVIRERTGAHA